MNAMSPLSLRHLTAALLALALVLGACATGPRNSERSAPVENGTASPRQDAETEENVQVLGKRMQHRTRLAVIGDFGTGSTAEHDVARQVKRWANHTRVAGLVTTGDNIYPDGHPDTFDRGWHEPYGWVDRRNITKVASLGNHDYRTDEGVPVMGLMDMPRRRYKQHFRWVDVFVVDSNQPSSDAQKRWLRRGLMNSKARWQIVAFHHPVFTCGQHDNGTVMRQAFNRILKRHGADLVLNGHEHSYQRFEKRGGVTYVVTGGGGAGLYSLGACPGWFPDRAVANDTRHHFVKLIVRRSRIGLLAVAPGGDVLDRHTLSK